MKEKSLSEFRRYYLDGIAIYHEDKVSEKVMRVEKRLKENGKFIVKDKYGNVLDECFIIAKSQIDEIWKEEFGEKLI